MKVYKLLILTPLLLLITYSCNKNQNIEPQKPFPQNIQYIAQHLTYSNFTQEQFNNYVAEYYENWKKRYIAKCKDGTYYVDFSDENPEVGTVSEAHGYGMMIVAYIAGYDPEAKTIFDGMYQFYKNHPSKICPSFMAWRQDTDCNSTGFDSATDGDEDIAFALLLADKQWGSNGAIDYLSEALTIVNSLKDYIFHSRGFPLLGDWADPNDTTYGDASRPSDWMLDHYIAFYNATGDYFWLNVIDFLIDIIDSIQTKFSPNTGLIPDFVINLPTNTQPAYPNFLESKYDGAVYYNACRVPWRLTTGQLFLNDSRLAKQINKINAWISEKTGGSAANITAGYSLNGDNLENYQDIVFTGAFAVAAMISRNQNWLNSCVSELMKPSLSEYGYYANTLRMLYLLVLSGNYWLP